MYKPICFAAAYLTSVALANSASPIERVFPTVTPSQDQIKASIAAAAVDHSTSEVQGSAFNRFVVIWLENTDFDKAAADPSMQWLSQFGVTLTNYWAVTHPSEPNYMASVSGDYFGLADDTFISMPSNVSTIVDLLDSKQISWAEYQEHSPYAGFQGFNYSNQQTFANDYVRKHNPLIIFDSVTKSPARLSKIKNFEHFYQDLEAQTLPQWSFLTPNMTNDGHDTNVAVSGKWAKNFLEPLMSNDYFMKDTLVLVTFDEVDSWPIQNKVYSVLLGGAVPKELYGTTDDTFYDHYSEISTVEANWNLNSLGRGDVDANVFDLVAKKSNVQNKFVDTTGMYRNHSAIGYISDVTKDLPAPNVCALNRNGQPVLPAIVSVWSSAMVEQYGTTCNVSSSMPMTSTFGVQNSIVMTTVNSLDTATVTSCPTTTQVMTSTNAQGEAITMTILEDQTTTVTICTRCDEGAMSTLSTAAMNISTVAGVTSVFQGAAAGLKPVAGVVGLVGAVAALLM